VPVVLPVLVAAADARCHAKDARAFAVRIAEQRGDNATASSETQALMEAARFAKERYGAAIWLERGSCHILSQDEIVVREEPVRGVL
jgi:hypothetical protein